MLIFSLKPKIELVFIQIFIMLGQKTMLKGIRDRNRVNKSFFF